MNIPWEKFLISTLVGFGLVSLLKPKLFSGQAQFFGFSGPNIQISADVPTPNCSPAGYGSPCGSLAQYCNPPGVECACGVDCADARVQYCHRYGTGGVCHDRGTGIIEPNQGLPGQGPIIGGALQDLANSFGFNPYTQSFGSASPYGYGYNPYNTQGYGYGYPQGYGYGYGYNYPPPYVQQGYPSFQQYPYGYGYGYGGCIQNQMCTFGTRWSPCFCRCMPAGIMEPAPGSPQCTSGYRRAYAVTGYDKKSGHFLYG